MPPRRTSAIHGLLGRVSLLTFLAFGAACGTGTSEDEVAGGSDSALEMSASLDGIDQDMLAEGRGLETCSENVGLATLCTHARGVVVLSDDGIALLAGKDGDLVAKALGTADPTRKDDVSQVLSAVRENAPERSSGAGSSGIEPQSISTAASTLLRGIVAALQESVRRAPAKLARKGAEGEVAVAKSSLAEDLTGFVQNMRAGQSMVVAPNGVTILGGTTEKLANQNARRWFAATHRQTIGILDPAVGAFTSAETVLGFTPFLQAAKATLRPGERLTIVMNPLHGSMDAFLLLAKREGVDVVFVADRAEDLEVAAVVQRFRTPADTVRAITDRWYYVHDGRVGPAT
jgi:hypothetical protein